MINTIGQRGTVVLCALIANLAIADEKPISDLVASRYSKSDYFDYMAEVMTGRWEGKYTNGTFDQPTTWEPVTVEYRLTSNGTAIVENYFSDVPDFEESTSANMTTVYHKDRSELRLTHYCGAANHPSMTARYLDPDSGLVNFEFTHITNLDSSDDYHSRQLNLDIVSSDHIRIEYHGIQSGKVYSQAYDIKRVSD